jgi:hypothetical protein
LYDWEVNLLSFLC